MRISLPRFALALFAGIGLAGLLDAEDAAPKGVDLSEYRTVEHAIAAKLVPGRKASSAGQVSYLGVHLKAEAQGKLIVEELDVESPAAKAGVKRGDHLVILGDQAVQDQAKVREIVQATNPGDSLKIGVLRDGKPKDLTAVLAPLSKPLKATNQRIVLGLSLGERKGPEGVAVDQVTTGSPADIARIKSGDVVLKFDGVPVTGSSMFRDMLAEKSPEDKVTLTMLWEGKPVEVRVSVGVEESNERQGGRGSGSGWDDRAAPYWKKDVYKLAVIGIEYPDVKHSDKVSPKNWEEALFSKGVYNKKDVSGQDVYGSLNDYYLEQSFNKLRVEGKFFPWVEVSKKRADYSQGSGTGNKAALLGEALDKLHARDGKDALRDFDGVFFLYAGDRVQTTRGGLYWPHRASFNHGGKRWSYFICAEGGSRMSTISVFCHEFGHMLGLPDLYARPENPGSEGVGVWCAMANQVNNGRPQHFGAWTKEKLGWITPTIIDPTVKQKLILSPIEESPKECLKILVRQDGSEYFLIENRKKKGFDVSLPAEGLLIWRVVNNKPILEEAHGIEGPSGPRLFPSSVPYPSSANSSFTPYTTPSSRSQLGGGLPVFLTNIRKLPDGRIVLHVGYEYN